MKNLHVIVSLALLTALPAPLLASANGGPASISPAHLEKALQAWCDGLLLISRTHREGGDARAVAGQVLDGAYN